MAFWSRWGNRSEVKSFTVSLNSELSAWIKAARTGNLSASASFKLARTSAVSIPLRYITTAAAGVTPVLKLPDKRIIRDHPVLTLLKNPSPDFDTELLFQMLAYNYMITGTAYVATLGSHLVPPLELQPFNTTECAPEQIAGGLLGSVHVSGLVLPGKYIRKRIPGSLTRDIMYMRDSRTQITQIRNWSEKDGSMLQGMSPLIPIASEINQNILGTKHNSSLLENGGRLSLVFNFENDMSDADFEETKDQIREQYGGSGNAGKIAVTAGGKSSVTEMGMNNKDMEYPLMYDTNRAIAASQFKFPLPLIFRDSSSYNNYKTAKLAMYDDAVLPVVSHIFRGLGKALLYRYDDLPENTELTYDDQEITALVTRRLEELKLRREINAETDNEIRAMMGREEVDGGDTIRDAAMNVPLGTDVTGADNEVLRDRNSDAGS